MDYPIAWLRMPIGGQSFSLFLQGAFPWPSLPLGDACSPAEDDFIRLAVLVSTGDASAKDIYGKTGIILILF